MQAVEVFIGSFPFSEKRIRRSAYLRYHFEHFLHEAYIFGERLDVHLKVITRGYRKDPRNADIADRFERLQKLIDDALEGVVMTRGAHVHEFRFSHADFERLDTLEFFEDHPINERSPLR